MSRLTPTSPGLRSARIIYTSRPQKTSEAAAVSASFRIVQPKAPALRELDRAFRAIAPLVPSAPQHLDLRIRRLGAAARQEGFAPEDRILRIGRIEAQISRVDHLLLGADLH